MAIPPTRDPAAIDYQWTNEQIKLLTDIRFKLLALVPPFVTVAVTLLSAQVAGSTSPVAMLFIGLLGLAATFGIVLYDLRNSQLYDALIHRAALLERKLGIETLSFHPGVDQNDARGGVHALRPRGWLMVFGFPITHGHALSLVYGSVLAAWVFPICRGLFIIVGTIVKALFGWNAGLFGSSALANLGATTTFLAGIAALCSAYLFFKVLLAADVPGLAEALIYHGRNNPLRGQEPVTKYLDATAMVRAETSKKFNKFDWLINRVVHATETRARGVQEPMMTSAASATNSAA
jgi:hypothetical protein